MTPTKRIFQLPQTDLKFTMIAITGGTFIMGDNDLGYNDEKPAHRVELSDFYLGETPVTQALWQTVMHDTDLADPFYFKGADRPAERISWLDCQQFLERLNAIFTSQNQTDGQQFRLPTEAQWEYAARGGESGATANFRYAGSNLLKEVGWYYLNSHRETKAVRQKFPNQLGLYDLSGNVWEWCADHWHSNYKNAPQDGSAWIDNEKNARRVVRGGSWLNDDDDCRVACRYDWSQDLRLNYTGLRLARY